MTVSPAARPLLSLGATSSSLFALEGGDRGLEAFVLPVGREALEDEVQRFRALIQAGPTGSGC